MPYGGIDEVRVDHEEGIYWVKRSGGNYWNKYDIEKESQFLGWIYLYKDEIDLYESEENVPTDSNQEDYDSWNDTDPNEDYGSWG